MIPEMKRILYATDLSENARHALAYAASLAHRYDAKMIILHLLDEIPPNADLAITSYFGKEKWEELRKQIEQEAIGKLYERVNTFCDEVSQEMDSCPYITEDVVVRRGNPVVEILREADRRDCDIIVMGTHGQGGLRGAMMGSTSRRVIRRTRIPVVVIPLPK
jgi:nucleotide-binding universal stress UspA family protein